MKTFVADVVMVTDIQLMQMIIAVTFWVFMFVRLYDPSFPVQIFPIYISSLTILYISYLTSTKCTWLTNKRSLVWISGWAKNAWGHLSLYCLFPGQKRVKYKPKSCDFTVWEPSQQSSQNILASAMWHGWIFPITI